MRKYTIVVNGKCDGDYKTPTYDVCDITANSMDEAKEMVLKQLTAFWNDFFGHWQLINLKFRD